MLLKCKAYNTNPTNVGPRTWETPGHFFNVRHCSEPYYQKWLNATFLQILDATGSKDTGLFNFVIPSFNIGITDFSKLLETPRLILVGLQSQLRLEE